MTATLSLPRPTARLLTRNGGFGKCLASLERPLLLAGHTAGLRTHPARYEQRTTTFLDQALGLKETP